MQDFAKLGIPFIITVNTDKEITGKSTMMGVDFGAIYIEAILGSGFDFDTFEYPSLHAFFFTRSEKKKYTPEAVIYISMEGLKIKRKENLYFKEFITKKLKESFGAKCIVSNLNENETWAWEINLDC